MQIYCLYCLLQKETKGEMQVAFGSVQTAGEIAQRVMEHLAFDAQLCVRQLSPRSKCERCADVCPVDAISITRSSTPGYMADMELNDEACIECGLCTQSCPTSAFSWQNPSLMQLRNKSAKLCLADIGKVYLTCDKTGIKEFSSTVVSVPCLGMLPWEFWLSLQSEFKDSFAIYLPDDLCGTCEVCTGEEQLIEQVTQAEQSSGFAIELETNKRELEFFKRAQAEGYDAGRRGFFSEIKNASKMVGNIALETAIGAPDKIKPRSAADRYNNQREYEKEFKAQETENATSLEDQTEESEYIPLGSSAILTARRTILLETLKRKPELTKSVPIILPSVNKNCTDCKACAYLCPTEAITIGSEGIQLNPIFCTACILCQEICWPNAIEFEQRNGLVFSNAQAYKMRQAGVIGTPNMTGVQDKAKNSATLNPQSISSKIFNLDDE